MITFFDNWLRHLFLEQIPELNHDELRVRFQPPDEQWRSALQANALNIYLADIRENRELRSNERTRKIEGGKVKETPAPRYIDCHYLITAWSPVTVTPNLEPTLYEHSLLYEATRVLMHCKPLTIAGLYSPNAVPLEYAEYKDLELPLLLLPEDGFSKYGEFWGAMGAGSRWKPAIYLIVTLPVLNKSSEVFPQVTSHVLRYHFLNAKHSDDNRFEIAGRLVKPDTAKPNEVLPISDITLLLTPKGGQPMERTTNNDGRFVFVQLAKGEYTLTVQVNGKALLKEIILPPATKETYTALPTDHYDLLLIQHS
ncbi:MAG: Pvc16 family protein [Caldilineaceae bacterium]